MDDANGRTGIYHTFADGVRREVVVELPDAEMVRLQAGWPPARRLRAAADHMRAMRLLQRAQIRSLNPAWTDQEVQAEMARRALGERVFAMLQRIDSD